MKNSHYQKYVLFQQFWQHQKQVDNLLYIKNIQNLNLQLQDYLKFDNWEHKTNNLVQYHYPYIYYYFLNILYYYLFHFIIVIYRYYIMINVNINYLLNKTYPHIIYKFYHYYKFNNYLCHLCKLNYLENHKNHIIH